MAVESEFNPKALSKSGKAGLMQLTPEIAKDMHVSDVWNPAQNIDGGARYLRILANQYDGDLTKTLAAYNAGPEAVRRAGGIPSIPETREYVRKVLAIYEKLKSRTASATAAPSANASRALVSCKETADCKPPILVDHFDSLSDWSIVTRSTTFRQGWESSPRGFSGSGAHNKTGGAGFGATMSRTVNLSSAAVCDLMVYKPSTGGSNFTRVTFSVDGIPAWSFGSSDPVARWVRKSAEVTAGVHTIKIATDLAGEVMADELECHPR